jgi:hypothetical protein
MKGHDPSVFHYILGLQPFVLNQHRQLELIEYFPHGHTRVYSIDLI